MATVSAGTLNLTANISGDFGHHVFTSDQSRTHTTEYRPACAVVRSNTAGEYTQTHDWEKVLDWTKYPDATKIYAQNNYYQSGYIRQFEPEQQYVEYELETTATDQKVTFRFDFGDYLTATSKTSLEIKFLAKVQASGGDVNITSGSGTGKVNNLSADGAYSATLNDFSFDNGIVDVTVQSNNHYLSLFDVKARITVTGPTRAYTDWIDNDTPTITNNTISSDIDKDTKLKFNNLTTTLTLGSVTGCTTAIGVIDSDNAQSTENKTLSSIESYVINSGKAIFSPNTKFAKIMQGYHDVTTPYEDNLDGSDTLIGDTTIFSKGLLDGITMSVWFYYDGTVTGRQELLTIYLPSDNTPIIRVTLEITTNFILLRVHPTGSQSPISTQIIQIQEPRSSFSVGWNHIVFSCMGRDIDKTDSPKDYPILSNSFVRDDAPAAAYFNGKVPTTGQDLIQASEEYSLGYVASPGIVLGGQIDNEDYTGPSNFILENSDSTNAPIHSIYIRDRFIDLTDSANLQAFYQYGIPPSSAPTPNFPSKTYAEGKTTISAESGPDLFIHVDSNNIKIETQGYYRRQSVSSEWPSSYDFSSSIYPGTGYPYVWSANPDSFTPSSTTNVSIDTSLTGPSATIETDLRILAANSTILAETSNISTIIGGAPITLTNTSHNRYTADTDAPVINYFHNELTGYDNNDVANVSIELANIHPAISSFENTFVRHKYLVTLPVPGESDLDVNASYVSADTGTGVIIDADIDDLGGAFTKGILTVGVIIKGEIDSIDTAFTMSVLGGMVRTSTIDADVAFTQTTTANPLRSLLSIDLESAFRFTADDAGTGVIIDNTEVEALQFSLVADDAGTGVIIDAEINDIDVAFTTEANGGLFIEADIDDISGAFSVTADPTRFTQFIDQSLIVEFFPAGLQPKFEFHHDIYDEFNNPIAPGVTVRRVAEYDDMDVAFTSTLDNQVLRRSVASIDLQWTFTKTPLVTILHAPLNYHTIAMPNITRTATAHSDRTAILDNETRIIEAHSDRTISVNTENRQLKARLKYD